MDGTITLRARAADIEAVYFRHGYFDPWTSVATEWARRAFWGGLLLAGCLFAAAVWLQGAAVVLGVLAAPVSVIPVVVFGRSAWRLRRSKQRIRRYAREVEAAGPAQLTISDEGFTLVYNGSTSTVPWSAVRSGSYGPDVVFLYAETSYLFPRASMPLDAFEPLLKLVKSKVPLMVPLAH